MSTEDADDADTDRFVDRTLPEMLERYDVTDLLAAAAIAAVRAERPLVSVVRSVCAAYESLDPDAFTMPRAADQCEADLAQAVVVARHLAEEFLPATLALAVVEAARRNEMSPTLTMGLLSHTLEIATK